MKPRSVMPALLAFACGFASLSVEILWVRLYGYARLSTPAGFGFVLMAYLLGIALGALTGSATCKKSQHGVMWLHSAMALLLSAFATFLLPQLFGWMIYARVDNMAFDVLLIAASSAILAYVFPIAHHLGADAVREDRQGRRFASVYMANVMGASIGPLVTGYVLLDHLTLQQCFLVLSIFQAVAGLSLMVRVGVRGCRHVLPWTLAAMGAVGLGIVVSDGPHSLVAQVSRGDSTPITTIENRHGIVTIIEGNEKDDIVYGGNVYDGRTNVDLMRNTNGLDRVVLLSALQPKPRRVLMVGLSIGTWLALVRQFPGVESIDVVEINSGYLEAARAYRPQAAAIEDARVNIIVDDARRWLRSNPEKTYDLVVMNTTWHWRANTTLLLSQEFLQLARRHMAKGAVMAFNTTGSPDAFHTATVVFPHAYRYGNFVYGAEFDFRPRKELIDATELSRMARRVDDGASPLGSPEVEKLFGKPFSTIEQVRSSVNRPLETISDLNMITEFKYGSAVY